MIAAVLVAVMGIGAFNAGNLRGGIVMCSFAALITALALYNAFVDE